MEVSVWFEILRTGEWQGHEFDEARLDEIISNFNPALLEPPLTIEHTTDARAMQPAEGWVCGLQRIGDRLFCQARDVTENLKYEVNSGRFPKRSVDLTLTDEGLVLTGVAFLGARPPQVTGLANFQFSSNGENLRFSMECNNDLFEGGDTMTAEEKKKAAEDKAKADAAAEQKKADDAIQARIDAAVTAALEARDKAAEEASTTADAEEEPTTPETPAEGSQVDPIQFARLQDEQKKNQSEIARLKFAARLSGCQVFVEKAKIPPAATEGLADFLASLGDTPMQFAAGKPKQSQLAFMEGFLAKFSSLGDALFKNVDGAAAREDEEEIPGEVIQFAKERGLDPKAVNESLKKTGNMKRSLAG